MLLLGRVIVLQVRFYRLVLLEEERKVRDEVLDYVHCTEGDSHERNWARVPKRVKDD